MIANYQTGGRELMTPDEARMMDNICALSTEMNLALALENYNDVESVDFETVWGQGHTTAERTGNSTDNFIEWLNECVK